MAASLVKKSFEKESLEETLRFSIVGLEESDKDVALLSKLAQRALFCPDKTTREKAQRRIYQIYHGAVTSLDIEEDKIFFTIENGDGKHPTYLCKIPNYLMDQPYHPVLFSE